MNYLKPCKTLLAMTIDACLPRFASIVLRLTQFMVFYFYLVMLLRTLTELGNLGFLLTSSKLNESKLKEKE